jgi:hypothetical protein
MARDSQLQRPPHIVNPLNARQPDVVLSRLTDPILSQTVLDLLLKDIGLCDLNVIC